MQFSFNHSHLFIYRRSVPTTPGGGESQTDNIDQELMGDVNGLVISEQSKQWLRDYLVSGEAMKIDIVRRFVDNEIKSERQLEEEIHTLRSQEASWGTIRFIQRDISNKIRDTLEDVEVYRDLVPYKRKQFDRSMTKLKKLNNLDARLDGRLKENILKLREPPSFDVRTATGPAQTHIFAPVSEDLFRPIYERSMGSSQYTEAMERLERSLVPSTPLVGTSQEAVAQQEIRKLIAAIKREKLEEFKLEQNFRRTTRELDRVVIDSLDKAKNIARRDELIESASNVCGVTLKAGTEIKVVSPDPSSLITERVPRSVHIVNVEPQEAIIRDDEGNPIGRRFGTIMITFNDQGTQVTMPLGRFKKWLDATGGFEEIANISSLQQKTLLAYYDIDIAPGMELSYIRHRRERDGSVQKIPTIVSINSIYTDPHGTYVVFNEPVQYSPGFEDIDYYEMRDRLSLGEFLKWWHRYDAEASMDVVELRSRVEKWRKRENKIYDEDLAPISVTIDEELRYPGENSYSFRIKSITDNGITLDNGRFLTFTEFYKWVERNHVEVVPEKPKKAEQEKHELENKIFAELQKEDDKEIYKLKEERAEKLLHNSDVYKSEQGHMGLWKRVKKKWYTTQFLSLKDIGNMYKEVSEFIKRRHERQSKGRYSQVGERLPGLIGVEFERAKEDAEHEEVGKYQHAMEHWGIDTLRHVLHTTNDKDVCKAAIIVLVGKGEMRWEDPVFWETINNLTFKYTNKGGELHIPQPHQYQPMENYEDKLSEAIDSLWAKRQFLDWSNENKSKYNSNLSTLEQRFKELEADPKGTGGPDAELKRMLKKYITTDEYVNPHEYESMIDGAIKNGKMSAEKKMFYMITGLAAVNPKRHPPLPLISYERIGEMNSRYLSQFPLMDFFTQVEVPDPFLPLKNGKVRTRKFKMQDFQEFIDRYFHDEVYEKFEPGPGFSRFMWEKMLPSDEVRTRISKGLRSADNMDHDDAHMYIPPADYEEMKKLLGPSTGNKLYFTMEGYSNGYPGFNQWIRTLANVVEEETDTAGRAKKVEALQTALNSFMIFDLILTNSIYKEERTYARLDRHHYKRGAVTDPSCNLELHQAQLRNLIMELSKEYGYEDQFAFLYTTKIGSVSDPKERQKHDEYKAKVEGLKEIMTKMVTEDNGRKALRVIRRLEGNNDDSNQGLRGLKSSRRPDLAALQKQQKTALHTIKHRVDEETAGGHH